MTYAVLFRRVDLGKVRVMRGRRKSDHSRTPFAPWGQTKSPSTAPSKVSSWGLPAIRPSKTEDANEFRASVALALKVLLDPPHGEVEVFLGTGPAGRNKYRFAVQRRNDQPESSARAGIPLFPPPNGFYQAFSIKVRPVSSGSGKSRSAAETVATPNGRNRSAISRALPGLWEAITSLSSVKPGHAIGFHWS